MKRAKVKKLPKQTKTSTLPKAKSKPVAVVDDSKPKSRVMACVVTGIEKRVSKAGMAKGIKKFGDLTAFIEHYISNEAKRLLKQRVSPEEVQKQLRPSNLKPFTIDKQILARLKLLKKPRNKKLTIEEVQQISVKWVPKEPKSYPSKEAYIIDNTKNGSCIAPQLFLDSDRCCDHCQYTKHCLSTAKTFSKRYKASQ
ncbi:hypothetical protein UFOVP760_106 [uncultured Caudovirales phage]|uniref:Uncharacterized protein n=1 Tax=uncultured Caudovirales phage TaxID=2100421 RepID=A0A6J7X8V6_9CAUD|nr:hypothetical protein UFOVP760_106 [uncultured Caudovirales phage]